MTSSDGDGAAREAILNNVRRALHATDANEERARTVSGRLERPVANTVPLRALESRVELMARFRASLEGQSADIFEVSDVGEIPSIIMGYLKQNQLPLGIRMGNDPYLGEIPWQSETELTLSHGPTDGQDMVTLSKAFASAAETGTLFLCSGPNNPTTLNFLADTHIVVVDERNIYGSYEEVWGSIRADYGAGTMPRVVNLIGGPSRTADIEQTIVKGAHGPRRFAVIIVGAHKS